MRAIFSILAASLVMGCTTSTKTDVNPDYKYYTGTISLVEVTGPEPDAFLSVMETKSGIIEFEGRCAAANENPDEPVTVALTEESFTPWSRVRNAPSTVFVLQECALANSAEKN